ncbi:kelch repeat containing protein [Rhodotorula toruloides]|uniref:Kelch repeat containing protein n=1 Tax=Rhodotorula toruloides TaxID=5286 RepID=A0A511K9X3_RHOTO|nr:kelch repeat containing protein [Rhodotorula toruloides]
MPTLTASWRKIASLDTLQRSSHSLAVAGPRAYIFGGELKPRTPVDADLSVLDIADGSLSTLSASTSSWPTPRVGASLTSHPATSALYLWGGRGGKDMGALTSDSGTIWKFDVSEGKWDEVNTEGERPEGRSYHTMCAVNDTLYLHAGCPSSGRLSTLHSLSLSSLTWSTLPSAPEPGRGGTVLTALPGGRFLARFGGFAGYELGGLDVFDVQAQEWTSVEAHVEGGTDEPPKRSVHAFVGLRQELDLREGNKFHNDVYALVATTPSTSSDLLPKFSWLALSPSPSGPTPSPRGWLASALSPSGQGLVVHGGLDQRNERLGDAWVLELEVEVGTGGEGTGARRTV